MGLQCPEPRCRCVIRGMTGLTEIHNLMKHYAKKHHYYLSMSAALTHRVAIENGIAQPLTVEVAREVPR